MDGFLKWAIWLLPIGWLAWWLWWQLPKREVAKMRYSIRSPKDRVEVEDTLRKTISQALGAIAVLIGAGFALAQFLEQRDTAQQQIAVSQKQVDISQQQVQTSHDLLISNQVSKGFEQLGNEKLVVRLGGIYALEGVMNGSVEYYQPVLEALCAFVRDSTAGYLPNQERPATDIQAVLTVIGRRKDGPGLVSLAGADIRGASLVLARLSIPGMSPADLRGANLSGANLNGAHLSLANLSAVKLRNAILAAADLSYTDLSYASLHLANLTDANLRYDHFTDADLTEATLDHADLTGATLDNADLTGATLTGVKVAQSQLDQACGTNAKLPAGRTLKACPP